MADQRMFFTDKLWSFDLPVTGWGDKVEKGVNTVVPEAGVTLDTGLLGQNIIVLSLKVPNNL